MRPTPTRPRPIAAPAAAESHFLMADTLRITQVRSPNGANPRQRDSLRTLGLGRIGKRRRAPRRAHRARPRPAVGHLVKVDDGSMSAEMGLHNLKPARGSRRPRKRVGRGEGSGFGKTSGRGEKGAGARAGAKSGSASRAGRTRSTCGCASCAART